MQGRPHRAAFFYALKMQKALMAGARGAHKGHEKQVGENDRSAGAPSRRLAHQFIDLAGNAVPFIGVGWWVSPLVDVGPLLGQIGVDLDKLFLTFR
ncbi:hypothetical protein C8D96_0895 [Kushneria marisflavi]|nr:hypothetical protein C8D96_0895 [Kushneria marisflavi]